MSVNVDALVREGAAAFKAGKREEAHTLLMKAVELDQYNEQAWLWLGAVVETTDDQRTCLENVLAINPNNERARQGLEALTQKMSGASAAADGFGNTSGSGIPSSVEWASSGLETGSPSSFQPVRELSDEEYDDWLTNLNLPSTGAAANAFPTTPPFGESSALEGGEDDLFSNGPFSAPPIPDIVLPPPDKPASAPPAKSPAPAKTMSPGRKETEADEDADIVDTGLFAEFSDEYEDVDLGELNAEEVFQYIPAEIKATRLPGTVERYPALLTLGLIVLILLNVGAAALLVYRLMIA